MGEIHVHEFMTADGIIDAPIWTFEYGFLDEMGAAIGAMTASAGGILLGRNTYEMFEPAWSTRTVEDDPGAPFFNESPKYVVSSRSRTRRGTTPASSAPYDPDAIRRLKDDVGDLYISGSITLVRALLADGLIDGLHLFQYPLTRGEGPRLFPPDAAPTKLDAGAQRVVRERRRLPALPAADVARPRPPRTRGAAKLARFRSSGRAGRRWRSASSGRSRSSSRDAASPSAGCANARCWPRSCCGPARSCPWIA